MMWLTASVATTMSPMLMDASSDPAMPVFSSAPTPKRSTSTCAHVAAFTMPTPHCTSTTVVAPMTPTLNSMPAMRVTFTAPTSRMCSRISSISTSMAPMMPMLLIGWFMFRSFAWQASPAGRDSACGRRRARRACSPGSGAPTTWPAAGRCRGSCRIPRASRRGFRPRILG